MLVAPLLHNVSHGFTTRREGDFRPGPSGEPPHAAAELVRLLGGRGTLRTVVQVHGGRVVDADAADGRMEADAIVSCDPGVVIAVRVADCVPILLAAPGGVAAVHAGWRGVAADIPRLALAELCRRAGCAPAEVRAAIGPAICGACYEVGDEVVEAVARVAPGSAWRSGRNVDLGAATGEMLRSEGVRVERVPACTRCSADLWSFRRDGAGGGRQVGAITR